MYTDALLSLRNQTLVAFAYTDVQFHDASCEKKPNTDGIVGGVHISLVLVLAVGSLARGHATRKAVTVGGK